MDYRSRRDGHHIEQHLLMPEQSSSHSLTYEGRPFGWRRLPCTMYWAPLIDLLTTIIVAKAPDDISYPRP